MDMTEISRSVINVVTEGSWDGSQGEKPWGLRVALIFSKNGLGFLFLWMVLDRLTLAIFIPKPVISR